MQNEKAIRELIKDEIKNNVKLEAEVDESSGGRSLNIRFYLYGDLVTDEIITIEYPKSY